MSGSLDLPAVGVCDEELGLGLADAWRAGTARQIPSGNRDTVGMWSRMVVGCIDVDGRAAADGTAGTGAVRERNQEEDEHPDDGVNQVELAEEASAIVDHWHAALASMSVRLSRARAPTVGRITSTAPTALSQTTNGTIVSR